MFRFDNSFARELQGFYVPWQPAAVPAPRLLFLNHSLAAELGLDVTSLDGPARAAVFAGNALPDGAEPLAQAYAGHQFGGFSPQLGDGRALLLGEVIDRQGRRRDIAFKGSGRTPFARGGDGKAAVGPMLREVLIGEAMHALGIPTTRALAVAATGEPVYREHVAARRGADARGGEPHPRRDLRVLRLARRRGAACANWPSTRSRGTTPRSPTRRSPSSRCCEAVAERQAALIAQWMNVGFIHGVMNTDNMTISGETIDYGPCAFMEAYDPATVFSSIDHHGRYAFGNQPDIARWNLARLAEALLPLLSDDPDAGASRWPPRSSMRSRRSTAGTCCADSAPSSGCDADEPDDDSADAALAEDWLTLLHAERVDFTLGVAAAGRRRGRRRGAAARAVRRYARAGCLARRAGGRAAPSEDAAAGHDPAMRRRRARRGDAPRQSQGDSPQPSRGGGTGGSVGRRRSRALRTIARCARAAVRRGRRTGPLRRAGASLR